MYSFNSTDGWYEGRPVASGSPPQNRSSARSSPPTKTSITRTGLSSQIHSSRHSGKRVLCPRSIPSTKRFIRSLRKSRRNHTARITPTGAFLHSQGHSLPIRSASIWSHDRNGPEVFVNEPDHRARGLLDLDQQ